MVILGKLGTHKSISLHNQAVEVTYQEAAVMSGLQDRPAKKASKRNYLLKVVQTVDDPTRRW